VDDRPEYTTIKNPFDPDSEHYISMGEAMARVRAVPQYYKRDGTPYISTPEKPDFLQWAEMFEDGKNRIIAQNKTLYGERLSTVFLGMDHSFSLNPNHTPILYETMLFAPRDREAQREQIRKAAATIKQPGGLQWEENDEDKCIEKNFPHDNLQLRYATEREAREKHERLKLQCLIPPRWRRFLLYTIGEDETWK
jgi:hypothetical protein